MISATIEFIREHVGKATRPAFMCSFGKDSMTLAHLIRDGIPARPMSHGFPIEVIYHRDPWFPHKHQFADSIIRSWGMIAHDYLPVAAGVKVKPDMLELAVRYNLGTDGIDIPKNTEPPEAHPRRDYLCGLNDWLYRPKSVAMPYPWDLVIIGHKSSDVDPFEGPVPLNTNITSVGGVKIIFPLKDWTDDDVWNYIGEHSIPVDTARYDVRNDRADTWHNNDYTHACTACIDPREKAETVFCPKLKRDVPNVGSRVLQLRWDAKYIAPVPQVILAEIDNRLKQKIRNSGKVVA